MVYLLLVSELRKLAAIVPLSREDMQGSSIGRTNRQAERTHIDALCSPSSSHPVSVAPSAPQLLAMSNRLATNAPWIYNFSVLLDLSLVPRSSHKRLANRQHSSVLHTNSHDLLPTQQYHNLLSQSLHRLPPQQHLPHAHHLTQLRNPSLLRPPQQQPQGEQ